MLEELYLRDLNDMVSMEEEKADGGDGAPPTLPPTVAVCRSSSQPGYRRITPATAMLSSGAFVDNALPNSDLYNGGISSNAPHGSGKYVWSDGCMYEGEWRRGKPSGKGKFSWPSGATYEGEFRSGRIEGSGTFTGPDGDTYRGSWVADRKHGYGKKHYANGDFYEGHWKRNLQYGHGRYLWVNGNEYIGDWKNGVISGKGVLIWASGDRFKGLFENGAPKGNCVNSYGPANKRSSVDSARGSVTYFPTICFWESDGDVGDITCNIIDNAEASIFYWDQFDGIVDFRRGPCCFSKNCKKPGQTVLKGHKNYDLMLNLQLGIR